MGLTARRIRRWTLGSLLALLALLTLYVGLLTFPSPLFAHSTTHGGFRLYSDEPIPAEMAGVLDELSRRLAGMEHPPPRASQRIYLCHAPRRYAFFAFLTRMSPQSLAIGLSVANESFVSVTRVRRFALINQGRIRHSRFEGNLAEVVAHEIAHFNSIHAIGLRAHMAQPVWKSEGWAEYQANLAAIRADEGYDLRGRIALLLDDGFWSTGRGAARNMWESQLLVEYLGEVEGYLLTDLVRDEVTLSATRDAMIGWYRDRR